MPIGPKPRQQLINQVSRQCRPTVRPLGQLQSRQPARLSSSQRGYNARWRRYRLAFLSKPENALCRTCLQADPPRYRRSKECDHIIPHKGDQKLFWALDNHQPLCKKCHSSKTAREDGGFGRQVKAGGKHVD